jgi:hypothetical protein
MFQECNTVQSSDMPQKFAGKTGMKNNRLLGVVGLRLLVIVLFTSSGIGSSVEAWSSWKTPYFSSRGSTRLLGTPSNDQDKVTTDVTLRRLGLTGVSVSEKGFHVLWGLTRSHNDQHERLFWPWAVTTPQAGDKVAATSAQALTLCQLIAGIDLAGSRLPVDILAQVILLSCEQYEKDGRTYDNQWSEKEAMVADRLVGDIQKQLQNIQQQWFPKQDSSKPISYTDASSWVRARVRLPVATLDQIVVEPLDNTDKGDFQVSYHVQVRDYGSLTLTHVSDEVFADVLAPLYEEFTFSQSARRAFLTTCLSLRYKAPVLVEDLKNYEGRLLRNVSDVFPLYTTVQNVQTPSDRVVSSIERGWEVHQLQAAYNIAKSKNDMQAVAKIRAKLDEMDALPDLPVQDESDFDSLQ